MTEGFCRVFLELILEDPRLLAGRCFAEGARFNKMRLVKRKSLFLVGAVTMRRRTSLRLLLVVLDVFMFAVTCSVGGRTVYVDDDGPEDFATIQAAINNAVDGDTVIVGKGRYFENISLEGKDIILRSIDPNEPDVIAETIIDGHEADSVVTFSGTESSNCVLSGFTITNGRSRIGGGIYGNKTEATIEHNVIINNHAIGDPNLPGSFGSGGALSDCDGLIQCNIIVDNGGGYGGGLYRCNGTIERNIISRNIAYWGGGMADCSAVIRGNLFVGDWAVSGGALANCDRIIEHCTIIGNRGGNGHGLLNCHGTIKNCIVWQNGPDDAPQMNNCSIPSYSCVERWPGGGKGNINGDPQFACMGHWEKVQHNTWWSWEWIDPQGDYHLKSQAGRWDPVNKNWVNDDVTSPCIDAGDPASLIGLEPFPNGGRVNMGAYGGTDEASKSYFGETLCETIVAGDINGDCTVDWVDFAFITLHWLEEN